jgi:hypothetical protein
MSADYKYFINHPGEPAAGISGYTDFIVITVASGLPGGEPGEFQAFIHRVLKEWYDGAKVRPHANNP